MPLAISDGLASLISEIFMVKNKKILPFQWQKTYFKNVRDVKKLSKHDICDFTGRNVFLIIEYQSTFRILARTSSNGQKHGNDINKES